MEAARLLDRLREIEAKVVNLAALELSATGDDLELYKARLEQLDASHSRSWFGDHSSTYYEGFTSPPAGQSFDVEWGFVPTFNGSRNRRWHVYSRSDIRNFVFKDIGEEIYHECFRRAESIMSEFSTLRDQAIDLLTIYGTIAVSRYLAKINDNLSPYTVTNYLNAKGAEAPRMTRDSEEIAKGSIVPAHIQYLSSIQSFDVNRRRLTEFSGVLRNVIELVSMLDSSENKDVSLDRVFIGHGRSEQWRVLKDFLWDKLSLKHEEFNRISAAGIGTQERLNEMLNSCGFAFIVLTAEDLHDDRTLHARENVVHECGLFQGKLGWRKAIVLLEEGCEEFSNIIGLGQIRFPRGNIAGCFEQIRDVLNRESVVK